MTAQYNTNSYCFFFIIDINQRTSVMRADTAKSFIRRSARANGG